MAGDWKCPMCDEDGFDKETLGPHIKEHHPLTNAEHEALDDAEVAGPLEGGYRQNIASDHVVN